MTCTVTFNYDAKDHDELTLKVGDVIVITEDIEVLCALLVLRGKRNMY